MSGSPRYPRYGRFVTTGAALGFLAAVLLVRFAGDHDHRYSGGATLLYTGLIFGFVGGILGGALALVLERGPGRRADGGSPDP